MIGARRKGDGCLSPTGADRLSPKRFAAWLAGVGYSGRTDPAVPHATPIAAVTVRANRAVGRHGHLAGTLELL